VLGVFFVVGVVAAAWAIRPWLAAPVAFDVAAAVLHFQRLVSGRPLEDPYLILTTPKPLVTLLYGSLFSATHDWRSISFVALGAWGLCVSMAAALAWRLGGIVAALFVVVTFVCSTSLLLETSLALGSIWALLLWLGAGLAVTSGRPRWGLAGVLLALDALARLETFLIIGLGLAVLVALRFGPARIRRSVPAGAWLLAIGLLALPVMLVHDWLLTGDPTFWANVSIRYSAGARSQGRLPDAVDVGREIGRLIRTHGAATALAVIGCGLLAVRRVWPILVGVLALGPGVAAFLVVLALRGVYVDSRYLLPIEVTIMFTAGIALGAVRVPELSERLRPAARSALDGRRWGPGVVACATAIVAIALGVAVSPAIAPFDRSTRDAIVRQRDTARTSDLAVPVLRQAIATGQDVVADPILVPRGIRPRLIVDLDLPLRGARAVDPARLDVAAGYPAAGQIIVVDRGVAVPPEAFQPFEIEHPTAIDGTRLVPLLADPQHGAWVVRVERP
jgi:hypothetical protein